MALLTVLPMLSHASMSDVPASLKNLGVALLPIVLRVEATRRYIPAILQSLNVK